MIEQRRDAHRGSAGLSLTWQGLISRVRLLSRYMSIYRRLLTAGMCPMHPAAAAAAAAPSAPSAPAKTVADKPPPPPSLRRASTEDGMVLAAGASGSRGRFDRGVSLPEGPLVLAATSGARAGGEGVSKGSNGDSRSRNRSDGEQWGTNWVGGSSAEIRKLAEQIRTRFGRGALVGNRYSTEALQASNGIFFRGVRDV